MWLGELGAPSDEVSHHVRSSTSIIEMLQIFHTSTSGWRKTLPATAEN
jgi:hypothetical protein